MGRCKGLLDIGGISLLRAHADVFTRLGMKVRVVLGPSPHEHLSVLPEGTSIAWNARWTHTDMAHSLRIGLDGLEDAVVTPVDAAPAARETLLALLAAPGACVPRFEGRDGHPVRVRAPHTHGRLDERLRDAPRIDVTDAACLTNLNDPAAFARWMAGR